MTRQKRLPRIWIDQLNIGQEVEMSMQADRIVIRPARQPRHDWAVQFSAMAAAGDDHLPEPLVLTRFDQDEWEW
jgi:antitoxin component of MazEF toxin-antitoxin module